MIKLSLCFSVLAILFSLNINGQCNCNDYIYLNDTETDEVHKYQIQTDGSLIEIGSPWLPSGNISAPHGIAMDAEGYLYIGEVDSYNGQDGRVKKFDCDGNLVDANFIPDHFAYNMVTKDNVLYMPIQDQPNYYGLYAYDLCDGSFLGCQDVWVGWEATLGPNNDYYGSTGYGGLNNNVITASLDLVNFDATCSSTTHTTYIPNITPTANNGRPFGTTFDDLGNAYVVVTEGNGSVAPSYINKYDANGNFIMQIDDQVDDNGGFYGAWGIVYSQTSGMLYVSSNDDCIAVFDTNLNYQGPLSVPGIPNTFPKGIGINNECCPDVGTVVTTDVICPISNGTVIQLDPYLPCPNMCAGDGWVETNNNAGNFDACNNQFVVTNVLGVGCFEFTRAGTGPNATCGAINVEVCVSFNVDQCATISVQKN